jgi:diaminopropionate ammonia-lyase
VAERRALRFGLGSFKALGASYAISQILATRTARTHDTTFVCGSAGNHGVAVAAGARHFGVRARVHLPLSAPLSFAAQITKLGGEVVWSDATYEGALTNAALDARSSGAIHLSDRAASLDDEAPRLVMEGYTVIAEEARAAFAARGCWPTHVFLQAGVGSFAAAVSAHIRACWSEQPEIVVVEPELAACLAASIHGGSVGAGASVMHRLDCKIASALAIPVLQAAGVTYASVSDASAIEAAAQLAAMGAATTPSGAAGYAAWRTWSKHNAARSARPLVFVTERLDTFKLDPENSDA